MNRRINLKTTTLMLRNSIRNATAGGGFLLIALGIASVALSQTILDKHHSPTPTPTPVPTPSPTTNVWISKRTDGQSGSGTQTDPYDGSTADKFDALMNSFQGTPNLGIHLMGAVTFQTYAKHTWFVLPGWLITGETTPKFSTTIQAIGDVTGLSGLTILSSDPNAQNDNITIQDLTVDCNWPVLGPSAPDGAGGEKNFVLAAIGLHGSNNLLLRARSINGYGSSANHRETFDLLLVPSRFGTGTNDVIQDCYAELPWGNHNAPFALAGWVFSSPTRVLTNSKVTGCTAVGRNSGAATGFSSGGVNVALVKDCLIDNNTFIDCYGAAYSDNSSIDGLTVTNNNVTRGWQGVGLANSVTPKQNVIISSNTFNIQNRVSGGGSYGIVMTTGATTNMTIKSNTISFDTSGAGTLEFYGISCRLLNTAKVSDNIIGKTPASYNWATDTNITLSNNRYPDGTLVPGLNPTPTPTPTPP